MYRQSGSLAHKPHLYKYIAHVLHSCANMQMYATMSLQRMDVFNDMDFLVLSIVLHIQSLDILRFITTMRACLAVL